MERVVGSVLVIEILFVGWIFWYITLPIRIKTTTIIRHETHNSNSNHEDYGFIESAMFLSMED